MLKLRIYVNACGIMVMVDSKGKDITKTAPGWQYIGQRLGAVQKVVTLQPFRFARLAAAHSRGSFGNALSRGDA